jgi:hypothetical protein
MPTREHGGYELQVYTPPNLKRVEVRRALEAAQALADEFLTLWKEIHGKSSDRESSQR